VQEKDIDAIIDFSKIGIVFQDKPPIAGGLAMEYHGARKHGDDIDFIVSLDMLFRMKVFAMDADEKHRKDVDLLKQQYEKLFQNKTYKAYLDAHVDRYLAVPGGTILNGDYDDDQ
jgi:hypothetical protein